ncbi:hypothetical protein PHMEG_00012812 [Phytophthora megakarya]|uniref:Uncharacterized protein n=1 Tax=Phytophthora megakarya TaxID=4795 RepID=A0A225W7V4_9STRA|nr:hypothetical protein PHMEG_00012812 [Phytophthora megakarya]
MAEYQADTHQLYHLRSSTSANYHNKEIKTADETHLIPKDLYALMGGDVKVPARANAKATLESPRKSKAEVKAAVTWNDDENKFMVRVTGCSIHHNNRVAQTVYNNHPSVRRVEDPVLLAVVDVIQSSRSKPKKIMRFLQEKTGGKNVVLRDVVTMVA